MDIYFERIKPLFDESGMTVKEIAAAIGCSYRDIYHWNTDGLKSYMKYLYQISDLFHVSVAYLKGETDIKNPVPTNEDGLNDPQKELIRILPLLSDYEVSVLLATAKSLIDGRTLLDAQ